MSTPYSLADKPAPLLPPDSAIRRRLRRLWIGTVLLLGVGIPLGVVACLMTVLPTAVFVGVGGGTTWDSIWETFGPLVGVGRALVLVAAGMIAAGIVTGAVALSVAARARRAARTPLPMVTGSRTS